MYEESSELAVLLETIEEQISSLNKNEPVLKTLSLIKTKVENQNLQCNQLQGKDKQLELVIKNTGVGIWDWYIQTGDVNYNERWANIIGYTLDEILPHSIETWMRFAHPDDLKESDHLLKEHWAGKTDYYIFESRMKHKDGHWIWVYDTGQVVEWDDKGQPSRMIGTHTDITDRKQIDLDTKKYSKHLEEVVAERTQALLVQEQVFQTMAMTASEGVFIINELGIVQFINAAAEKMFGYKNNELIGQNINKLMPQPHFRHHDQYIQNYIQTGITKLIGKGRQVTAIHKDGTRIPIYLSIGDVKLAKTHLFTGMVIDLREQINLQNEILKISDQEKIRIGGELHDGIGQQITGLGMLAKSLSNKVSNDNKPLSNQLVEGLQDALKEVRLLSRGLVPVSIDVKGLDVALTELCDRMSQLSHIKIEVKTDKRVHVSNNVTATHVYRIAQESINNALKHANASKIELHLMQHESQRGVIIVKDDGKGFDNDEDKHIGSGLRIIKHRCGLFDGEVIYKQGEQGGAEVRCYFPIDEY